MSESVEMYLITISRIAEATREETVPLPALAEKLDILPVSTNQMIRKLEDAGLVRYLPYKGVQLSEEGQKIAAQILRHHQLWEHFLIDHLNFPDDAAESLACRLEHIFSNDEIEHLAAFLDDPIALAPSSSLSSNSGRFIPEEQTRLTKLKIDQCGAITRVEADHAEHSFLSAAGVLPGMLVTILARGDTGDLLARVGEKDQIHLSAEVAAHIWLRKV